MLKWDCDVSGIFSCISFIHPFFRQKFLCCKSQNQKAKEILEIQINHIHKGLESQKLFVNKIFPILIPECWSFLLSLDKFFAVPKNLKLFLLLKFLKCSTGFRFETPIPLLVRFLFWKNDFDDGKLCWMLSFLTSCILFQSRKLKKLKETLFGIFDIGKGYLDLLFHIRDVKHHLLE